MSAALNIQMIDQLDRGMSYAESCFETFRVTNGSIFLWDRHWQRLQLGLTTFGIHLSNAEGNTIHKQCLDAARATSDDCLIRLSITGGTSPWGLNASAQPEIYIQALPFLAKGNVALKVVEFPFPLMPKPAKYTSDYALTLRAKQQWNTNTPLICKDGFIISGMTANVALFIDDQWVTPDGGGVLQGTIRQFFIDSGLLIAQPCPTKLCTDTQAVVLLNSGSFIQVVSHIDSIALDVKHAAIQTLKHQLQGKDGVTL